MSSQQAAPAIRREPAIIECADGWRLDAEVLAPAAPRAVAVVGHAMMVDRRTLSALAGHLAEREIAVVCPDLRGHGRSGPGAEAGGRWSYDDLVELDVPALYRFARRRFPGLALTAVGHSLFGHVAMAHAARHEDAEVDRLALLAANVWAPRWEPDRMLRVRKWATLESMAAVTRLAGRFPTRRLRMGSCDEAADYVAQMVGFLRADDWMARDGFSWAQAAARIRPPLLAIAGAGDRLLCRPECARRFVSAVPGAHSLTVGRASGLPFDPGHMALGLDPRCAPAWDSVARFALGERMA